MMAVLHIPLSDIQRMEWEEMSWYHYRAIEFYKADKEAAHDLLVHAIASAFGAVGND